MRPLTDEETKVFFEKLAQFVGRNIKSLIDRKDGRYVFRLHRDRVYYVSERIMRLAAGVPRDSLEMVGTCFGKFTHSKKFHLKVTCLEYLHQFALHKVWVRPSAEMSFLYGNHVMKSGVARMTEGCPQHGGVIVCSMNNTPLGFGVAAQTTERCRDMEATQVAVLHQADVGEYLREEERVL